MGCGQSSARDAPAIDEGTMMFLGKVPLFKRLPEEDFGSLAQCCSLMDFRPGQVVVNQGHEGQELFVIKKGTAAVSVDGKKVAMLKKGDFFGESALLHDEPRNATITASDELKTIRVGRKEFREMGLNQKLDFARRGAVGGGAAGECETKPPTQKSDEEKKLMIGAIKNNPNLAVVLGTLDDSKIHTMIDKAWEENVAANVPLITAGSNEADYFYIVKSGSFKVVVPNDVSSVDQVIQNTKVSEGLQPGSSFGELALLYFAPRAADVVAAEASVVWVIDRVTFRAVLAEFFDKQSAEHLKILETIELFQTAMKSMDEKEKKQIAQALTEMTFYKNQTVFEQGAAGDAMFILVDGTVTVIKDKTEVNQLVAPEPRIFGEAALVDDKPRNATIKVVSEVAKTLTMDKLAFDMATGKKTNATAPGKEYGVVKRTELKQLGLLGCGGFGAVFMVEHQKTKESYALKLLSKGYVVKAGMQKSVISEKNVQMMCNSAFVVQLYETFNSDQNLELLLELALGGELYATYNKKAFWGKVPHAQFYVAGTVLAFEHLHSKKIIFRDLKPENLLLNEKGAVKLTDMGLAKVVPGTTFTTCGTPDYFAPELIAAKGHTKAVDWWTLGILAFELLSGHPPFEAPSPTVIYQKVSKGINKVTFPKSCKGAAETMIKSLCSHNPSDRLPMRQEGTDALKKHEWYAEFNWQDMESLAMTPPYVPHVKSKTDASNFSARKEDMPPQIPYKADKSGWDKDFATST